MGRLKGIEFHSNQNEYTFLMKQPFKSVGVELIMSNDYSFLLGSKDTKGMSNIFEKKSSTLKFLRWRNQNSEFPGQ